MLRKYNKIMLSTLLFLMINSIVTIYSANYSAESLNKNNEMEDTSTNELDQDNEEEMEDSSAESLDKKNKENMEDAYKQFIKIINDQKKEKNVVYPLRKATEEFFEKDLGSEINSYKFEAYLYYLFKQKFPLATSYYFYYYFYKFLKKDVGDKLPDFSAADYRKYQNSLNDNRLNIIKRAFSTWYYGKKTKPSLHYLKLQKAYNKFIDIYNKQDKSVSYPLREATAEFFEQDLGPEINSYKFNAFLYYLFNQRFPDKTINDFENFLDYVEDKLPNFSDTDYKRSENKLDPYKHTVRHKAVGALAGALLGAAAGAAITNNSPSSVSEQLLCVGSTCAVGAAIGATSSLSHPAYWDSIKYYLKSWWNGTRDQSTMPEGESESFN